MKVLICDVNNLGEGIYHETEFSGDKNELIELWKKNIFPFEHSNLKQIFVNNMRDTFRNYNVLIIKPIGKLYIRDYNTIFKTDTAKTIIVDVTPIDLGHINN
jgi:hypothetical protein